jgi:hypothetical protein
MQKGLNEQPRSGQKDEAHRDFADDEDSMRPADLPSGDASTSPVGETGLNVEPTRVESRKRPEQHTLVKTEKPSVANRTR